MFRKRAFDASPPIMPHLIGEKALIKQSQDSLLSVGFQELQHGISESLMHITFPFLNGQLLSISFLGD